MSSFVTAKKGATTCWSNESKHYRNGKRMMTNNTLLHILLHCGRRLLIIQCLCGLCKHTNVWRKQFIVSQQAVNICRRCFISSLPHSGEWDSTAMQQMHGSRCANRCHAAENSFPPTKWRLDKLTAVPHFNLLPFRFEFQRDVLLLDTGIQIYTDKYATFVCKF